MRDRLQNPEWLTKLYKISQYTAIALGLVAAAVPLVGLAAAAFGALAFWISTRRDALKDSLAQETERLLWEQEEKLREDNERLQAKLETSLRGEQRKREELEQRFYGNIILS
jgi:hypothetical protein